MFTLPTLLANTITDAPTTEYIGQQPNLQRSLAHKKLFFTKLNKKRTLATTLSAIFGYSGPNLSGPCSSVYVLSSAANVGGTRGRSSARKSAGLGEAPAAESASFNLGKCNWSA
jgi:hypothetical protein